MDDTLSYPSVRLRMDFRDPNTIGTFPYHCHLLEHEDKGMMGSIRVEPAEVDVESNVTGCREWSCKNCASGKISTEINLRYFEYSCCVW